MRLLLRLTLLFAVSCTLHRSDEVDVAKLPRGVRADYALFARRCSKCHSLARPLGAGITDDEYWARYVERMRLQPSSGISVEDKAPILRFLHYYSQQQLQKNAL